MDNQNVLGAGNDGNAVDMQVDDIADGAAAVLDNLAAAAGSPAAAADPHPAATGIASAASDPAAVSPRPRNRGISAPRDSDEDAESGEGRDELEARARHERILAAHNRALAAEQALRTGRNAQAVREAQATEATVALLEAQENEREVVAARIAELQTLLAGQLELEQLAIEPERREFSEPTGSVSGRSRLAISGVQTVRPQKSNADANAKQVKHTERTTQVPVLTVPPQGEDSYNIRPRVGRATINDNTDPFPTDQPTVADLFRDFTIERRQAPKNLDRVRVEQEEKERMNPPRKSLKDSEKLQNPSDFLLVIQHFNLIDGLITRKYWSGSVEQWCLEQILPGSPAASKINEALRGVVRQPDLNYFSLMTEYKKFILSVFFVGSDPFQVIEDHMSMITLHPQLAPSASNTCTTLGFTNRVQDLAAFVPDNQKYPEGILIARIRTRLPLYVRSKLTEIEMHTKIFLTTFDQLKPVLERIDAQFQSNVEKMKEKGQKIWDKARNLKPHPNAFKRKAADAAITVMHSSKKNAHQQSGGRQNPNHKLDKRPPCAHCKKPGHNESTCWIKFPHMKPDFKPRIKYEEAPSAADFKALAAQVAALSAATNT